MYMEVNGICKSVLVFLMSIVCFMHFTPVLLSNLLITPSFGLNFSFHHSCCSCCSLPFTTLKWVESSLCHCSRHHTQNGICMLNTYFYPLLVWPDMWLRNFKRPTCPVHFHGCHSHPGMSGEVFHLDVLFQKSFNLTLIFDTRQCGRIAITITLQKYDHKGPWWWSSGQHAHLRWSEFEARWCLHIFLQNLCLKRTKINKKRSVLAHFWKKYDDKDQTDHGGVLAVTMLALYSDIQVRIP